MRHGTAYCSACDRPVPVTFRHDDGPRDAAELVCLDYGARCTGALCPMFSVPGDEPAPRTAADPLPGTSPAPGTKRHRGGERPRPPQWRPSPRAD